MISVNQLFRFSSCWTNGKQLEFEFGFRAFEWKLLVLELVGFGFRFEGVCSRFGSHRAGHSRDGRGKQDQEYVRGSSERGFVQVVDWEPYLIWRRI